TFWTVDEYRPAIYNFASDGTLIERYVPAGTSLLGDTPQAEGFYGAETLPEEYSKRRANRGFEAVALDTDKNIVYAFIQTPMYNPDNSTQNASDVIRILGIDPADGTPVAEYVYLLERNALGGHSFARTDKIGDAVYAGNGRFYILERDSSDKLDGT
ncbi:esterase-like activity of phytase family protein, partial [Puniceicoccaceae bacterium K14]|nr:esterase-like activity of phytase family protein [Puniceicoccaceae bacterium K14]